MMPAVVFPDTEKVLVSVIKSAIDSRLETYTSDVFVATKKPAPDKKPYPRRIITVRSDGGNKLDWVRRFERVAITVWADDYSDASNLIRLVEALSVTFTGEDIKSCTVNLSPIRIDEAGPQECRYMTLEIITKGKTL
jgi:hypothetical protein